MRSKAVTPGGRHAMGYAPWPAIPTRLSLGGILLVAACLVTAGDWAARGRLAAGVDPRLKPGGDSRAALSVAVDAAVRVTRGRRWASDDLADYICYGAEEELLRSPLPRRPFWPGDHPRMGAGVVVDAEAHIVTADTLVGCDATAQVQFANGRTETARVVGRDPLLNVALLEVNLRGGVTSVAPLGGVVGLSVGSEVAVPAWERSAAHHLYTRRGRIINVGRVAGPGLFGPHIETDIPADEAEVGAPLLERGGKVIGFIIPPRPFSARGAHAVPIGAIQEVLPQLAGLGKVPRGWAGLMVQPGSPALADALGGGYEGEPVVAHVVRGGPADRAGMRPGDVVVLFGGVRIRSMEALANAIAKSEIGSMVRVDTLRGGRLHPFSIRVAETPQSSDWPPRSDPLPKLGVHVLPVTPGLRHLWDPRLANGLLVTRVVPAGPGEAAGLEPGDLLRAVNGHDLVGRDGIRTATHALRGGAPALWLVERDGLTRLVVAPAHDALARLRGPADGSQGPSRSGVAQGH